MKTKKPIKKDLTILHQVYPILQATDYAHKPLNGKKLKKKSLLMGIWKGLKISDKELTEAKKAPFDFDIEKYVRN